MIYNKQQRISLILLLILAGSVYYWQFNQYAAHDKSLVSIPSLQPDDGPAPVIQTNIKKHRPVNSTPENKPSRSPSDITFDPNKLDSVTIQKFEIKDFIKRNLLSYIKAGGRFRDCPDLAKIYGMDSLTLEILLGNCRCNSCRQENHNNLKPFDINLADTTIWSQIKGIGPVLSSRIIKYRNGLGGFYSVEQLKEVYGLDPEIIENNRSYFIVNEKVNSININDCGYEELKKHFYFDYKTSKSILNYRKQHGNFNSVKDLKQIKTMTDSLFEKIAPYLSV